VVYPAPELAGGGGVAPLQRVGAADLRVDPAVAELRDAGERPDDQWRSNLGSVGGRPDTWLNIALVDTTAAPATARSTCLF
jgi:hypothetical protein